MSSTAKVTRLTWSIESDQIESLKLGRAKHGHRRRSAPCHPFDCVWGPHLDYSTSAELPRGHLFDSDRLDWAWPAPAGMTSCQAQGSRPTANPTGTAALLGNQRRWPARTFPVTRARMPSLGSGGLTWFA